MERLKELISQLKEQFDHQAEPSQMLDTARLLEAELQRLASQPAPARVMPTKITVMMPSASKIFGGEGVQTAQTAQTAPVAPAASSESRTVPELRKEQGRNGMAGSTPGTVQPVQVPAPTNGSPAQAPASAPAATVTLEKPTTQKPPPLEKTQERGQWPFDPLAEKPTDRFTLSQKSKEVNDVIGSSTTSLNDKLRSDVSDLKSALNDSPVRDLRKAIGVNDRYVFINHLFRGDEVMYERSLKTINGFRILPEAEYWMERELKVKLGWDENNPTTRHFYQLVKRRFS
jgi:hypothetical protein